MEKGRVSYCRLCGELKALSTLVDVESNTQEIIIKLSRINVTADLKTKKLPKAVCEKCLIQLHKAVLFVQTIERGQRALSVIFQQISQEETDPLNMIHSLDSDTEQIKQESEQYHSELDYEEVKYLKTELETEFENEEEVSEDHASSSHHTMLSSEDDIPQEKSSHTPLKKECRGSHMTMMKTKSDQDQIQLDDEELKHAVEEVNEGNCIRSVYRESLQSLLEKPQRLIMRKPVATVLAEDSNVSKTTEDDNEVENKEDKKEKDTQPAASTSSLKEELRDEDSVQPDKCKSTTDKSKISVVSSPWKDYIWPCSVCEIQFPTHNELKHHLMEVHSICNVLRCYECNAIRSTLPLFMRHVRGHNKHLQHFCYKCHVVLHTRYQAGLHRLTHQLTKHICKGCHSSFNTPKELKDHISTYYKNILKDNSNINDTTCKECGKTFSTPLGLMQHLKMHTERKRDHTCEVCGKCFYNKQTLKDHMVVHNDERPFQCDICKLKFKSHLYLRKHVKWHIPGEQYSCDHCGRRFKFKSQIQMHLLVHTDSRPHACSYCDKAFRFRSNLAQHLHQHTGAKPFSCTLCQRDFTFRGNYNAHMKRRHNMNMGKKRLNNDETNSESAKKYVDSVLKKSVKRNVCKPRFLN